MRAVWCCMTAACIFTIDINMAHVHNPPDTTMPPVPPGPLPTVETPIVPHQSIGGRALVAVVAIMTFLASLTTGGVMLVRSNAADWQSEVLREITIQIRPAAGRDLDAAVKAAADLARAFPGVAQVQTYSTAESAKLLEPWLGSGLAVSDLPVPRVIVVKLASGPRPDIAALRKTLTDTVPGSSLDDHSGWIDRMRAIADFVMVGGIIVLGLVIAATILSVSFATRGAMAANRPIIEVLHFVGAQHRYIAGQFQRHFLWLGLKGGAIGGAAAILLFALIAPVEALMRGTAGADQFAALFGSISMGIGGYIVVLLQIVLIAAVAAEASRRTVNQTLASI